jgi:hypothetical protein
MQATQFKTSDAGRRVQGFLDTHTAAVGNAVPAELRAEFDAAVTQLATYQQEQESNTGAARGETANQKVLRADVYERFLNPIAKIVKRKLSQTPEVIELVVPARALRAKSFVAKATASADAAANYVPVFSANGLSADFVPQMKAAIAKITASSDLRARQLSRKSTATAELKASDKAIKLLIDQIGAVITPALKGNTDALSDWAVSKRVHRTPVTPLPTGNLNVTPAPTGTTQQPAPATPTLVESATQATNAGRS